MNLIDALAITFSETVKRHPDRSAIVFPERTFTYENLWQLSTAFALRMRASGVSESSTVHVNSADLAITLPAILATSLIGAKFLQNVGDISQDGIPAVTHNFTVGGVGSDSDSIRIDETWSPVETTEDLGVWSSDTNPDISAPWMLVFTSGTTGQPKFVALSQQVVVKRCLAVAHEFEQQNTRIVSGYPYDSRPFFARALAALLAGATIVDEINPSRWADLDITRVYIPAAKATAVLESLPHGVKFDAIEIAGSAVSNETIASLLEHFLLVDDTYGATETSKSYSNIWVSNKDGSVKRTVRSYDSEFEIRSSDGKLCDIGVEGHIRVRTNFMADHYIGDPDASAIAFNDGWFHPGDRGTWQSVGVLKLSRRDGDVVHINGMKGSLRAIDHVIAQDKAVLDCASFRSAKPGQDDSIVAFVVLEDGANPVQTVARIKKTCEGILGKKLTPTRFWPINEIPQLPDGSPDRERCQTATLKAATKREL